MGYEYRLPRSQQVYQGEPATTGDSSDNIPSFDNVDFVQPTSATDLPSLSTDLAAIATVSSENLTSGAPTSAYAAAISTSAQSSSLVSESLARSPVSDDCDNTCCIFYSYVSVFYPPATSSNTDCLTDGATLPSPTLPPGLQPYVFIQVSALVRNLEMLNSAAGSQIAPMF